MGQVEVPPNSGHHSNECMERSEGPGEARLAWVREDTGAGATDMTSDLRGLGRQPWAQRRLKQGDSEWVHVFGIPQII